MSRSQSFAASRKAIPQTLVPSLSTLPQEPRHTLPELELFEDNPRKHRDSRGSEKTAVFDMEPSSVYVNNDIELPCLGLSEHLKTNSTSSPSQKTLSGACTMLCDEQHIHGIFADNIMTERTIADMAFDQEMDVFQTCSSKSRRHYSVGIPEHLQPAENSGTQPALGGIGGISGCVAAPLNSQWAMYARSSYAESGLVKSTFDLVKLLPSAPQ
ncbi:hypothetical protein GGI11_000690 [Coemansia sp. RSA 2049]|nr:hypothetical protein H4217_007272 [Coemansia sp. RSA 1939]KAJ2524608.1 hypothetical protein GGI11_000690 [Coemansia sp. RSA 2049]KAJ2608688.1 hypothetical protein EV177_004850 [Coemansia sp. RSA 1804]